MSDDEHIDHVEYDDSDGELPNKESVISNERKSYEFPVANTDEKEQLMGNQSETITQLTQNNVEELKLKYEPQHVQAETNHQEIVNDQNQEIDRENEENKKFIDHEEEQHINQVQKSPQEHGEEIVYTSNDIANNQEVKIQEPLIEDRLQDLQILKSQLPDCQKQKEQAVEIIDQNKKETDKQIHQQAVQDGSNPNNQSQIPHLQNELHDETKKEEEVHQNRSQFFEKQEKSVQQETNSILDRAVYEQPASQVKVGEDRIQELEQFIHQQQKIEQNKNQPIPQEQQQKKDPPVQVFQQIISQPKLEPIELKKEEKVEIHRAQNDVSLSEQKIKPERRGTVMHNEMTSKSIKGRNNAPPQMQQAATQNAKACKCVIM